MAGRVPDGDLGRIALAALLGAPPVQPRSTSEGGSSSTMPAALEPAAPKNPI
ncbi:MAG TPA: hypothetical protein VL738_06535 [Dactylosporangium sp.]|nr:hypothetical protein [Dactylosporangium sp.]